jgi:hypothetical protein
MSGVPKLVTTTFFDVTVTLPMSNGKNSQSNTAKRNYGKRDDHSSCRAHL